MTLIEKTEFPEKKEIIPSASPAVESTELNKLFEALAKAQLEMEVAKPDKVNSYFKSRYADLTAVVRASRKQLAKNGLCVVQRTTTTREGKILLFTRLCHSSGQWIESNMEVKPPKPDIQTLGSYVTYLRRYMYASLVGVVASSEDDDGEKTMESSRKKGLEAVGSPKISKSQLEVLGEELSSHPQIVDEILKAGNIKKLSDLPANRYTKCITHIREIKYGKRTA